MGLGSLHCRLPSDTIKAAAASDRAYMCEGIEKKYVDTQEFLAAAPNMAYMSEGRVHGYRGVCGMKQRELVQR